MWTTNVEELFCIIVGSIFFGVWQQSIPFGIGVFMLMLALWNMLPAGRV